MTELDVCGMRPKNKFGRVECCKSAELANSHNAPSWSSGRPFWTFFRSFWGCLTLPDPLVRVSKLFELLKRCYGDNENTAAAVTARENQILRFKVIAEEWVSAEAGPSADVLAEEALAFAGAGAGEVPGKKNLVHLINGKLVIGVDTATNCGVNNAGCQVHLVPGTCDVQRQPIRVITGLVSKFEMETKVGSTWNWMSSFFCWSLRELRKPGLRLWKELSFGANSVKPLFELRSWALIWVETCVVVRRRIRVVKPPAFLRILMMSVGDEDGDGAGERSIRRSERERRWCFFIFIFIIIISSSISIFCVMRIRKSMEFIEVFIRMRLKLGGMFEGSSHLDFAWKCRKNSRISSGVWGQKKMAMIALRWLRCLPFLCLRWFNRWLWRILVAVKLRVVEISPVLPSYFIALPSFFIVETVQSLVVEIFGGYEVDGCGDFVGAAPNHTSKFGKMKIALRSCLGFQFKIRFRFRLKKGSHFFIAQRCFPFLCLRRFNHWLWRFLVAVKLRVVEISLVPLLIALLNCEFEVLPSFFIAFPSFFIVEVLPISLFETVQSLVVENFGGCEVEGCGDFAGAAPNRSSQLTQQLAPTVGQGFKNSQGAMATKFDVEKFNGANDFGLWKIKMEAILIQQGCDEALKGESAIILCLGDKVLREVAKEKTAAEIWAKLESLYMTRSLAHRLCLKQQLFSFKMSESRTIEEQIAEFSKIVDDLENIEVKLEDEDKAVILLNALPRTFEHFRDVLLYGKDQVITLEEVVTSIRTKEFQKLQDSKTIEEGASGLISVKGKWKKQAGKEKKLNSDGTKQVRCFKCQKMGHIKKFCPEKGKAGRPQETADVAEASEGYESAGVLVASSEDPQRSWVMDSGCSYHMCPMKEFFENLDQKKHGNVLLGNNKACRVQGVGSVRLKMFDNREMVLQAVRYVPELKRNLISISSFDLGGYTTKVEDGVMRVCSGDSVVAKGRRRNGLYILEGSTVIGHVSVASGTENTARLWHLRMGHISEKGLEELEKQGLLLGDKLQKLDFCDHCVLGKSHRIPFGKGKHSTERPFEYVHADLWGPARTLTHGGGAYFLSIIDDFSRRVWIYVLKNKSETFQKFKEWHTQIENQLGCRLKCLRTDNGLEFVSEEFNGFCKEKGIRRHRTVVGTPQQNGLAERMNRTILVRVRCMLLGSGLSKAFWGEAANTAVYLINRSLSSALNFKTPMEVWSGRPTDYSHLRVFGSLAFAHVRGDKLDSRAAKCIFLGYAEGVKGYRLWRLDSPSKLIISRDVIFYETRMAMHPENSGSEKKILVEVEHTTNGAGTPGGTEENQTGEGRVENGRTIEENRSDEFRTDLGDDTDGMSGEGSHGKAAGVDLRNYQLVRDRERRISKPTKRFGEADLICYALNAAEDLNRSDEPRSYKEALDSSDRHLWQGAMEEELEALKKNSTWRLVDLPKGKKVIGSKWIFKKKEATPGGEKARYKARLVAKGFTQIEGVDYHEIFAPVVKHCSVRVLMAIVVHCNLHLEQLDVRTAFLHGDLEETIYMKQPNGFAVGDRVCLLQKSLYGLKQSPRQWYRKFDDFLIKLNFKRCNYDDCVYTLNHDGEMLYLLLYVDDILIASSDRGMIGETKARLADAFEMKELGEARRILGIDIKKDKPGGNLFLSQECYLQKVISRYRMAESKMASTPVGQHLKLTKEQCPKTEEERRKMESVPFSNGIGSIMYGMVCTRPDVAHGVSVLSQFMVNPGPTHWEALKWMLRYIRGSLSGGYIEGFVDSDFAGCMDTRKSRSGYVFTLFGTAVSWRSTLQSVVALSTTEAEYYALAEGVKEALWLKGLVRELGFHQKSVCVHCDSRSAIHLANHQIYHSRTKHIDVKLHFVRSIVESGDVQICKIASEENPADMLTKPLAKERFLLLLSRIGCLPVGH
ncbi:hypothetical protein V8G54_026146 [Vigna mungo]|uniref:Uncharacterized protein n=1 Tax=Vigna mungo TaxID=3915 RepID=A0AAQ3RMY3_VIGMU